MADIYCIKSGKKIGNPPTRRPETREEFYARFDPLIQQNREASGSIFPDDQFQHQMLDHSDSMRETEARIQQALIERGRVL